MLKRELFLSFMGMLFEMYDRQPTKALLDGYYLVLQDMSDEDFTASIKSILSSRTYNSLPKPAEILEYSKPDTEAIATLAWNDIERAMIKGGVYSSVTFEDKVINSIIQAVGGWVELCRLPIEEVKWVKKEVIRLYGIYAKRSEHPHHLVGEAERINGGIEPNKIALVKASYQIPNIAPVPALNPPSEKVAELIGDSVKRIS